MDKIKPYVLPAMVLALFIVCFYPALSLIVSKWSASDDYAHAFFTVPIVGYMVWLKRELLVEEQGEGVIGLILLCLSIVFYIVSLQLQIPTFIFIGTVVSIISILIYYGGFQALRSMVVPILLLFMVIPIPNQLLSMITATLQLKVSEASEIIISLFSVPIFREGNVLHIPDKTFQVVEACSGIRSLISLTTMSLILGYFTLNKRWAIGLLLLLSIPVAIVINILRVVSLVIVYHFYQLDLSSGAAHTVMGLVLFLVGLGLLCSFQRILEKW